MASTQNRYRTELLTSAMLEVEEGKSQVACSFYKQTGYPALLTAVGQSVQRCPTEALKKSNLSKSLFHREGAGCVLEFSTPISSFVLQVQPVCLSCTVDFRVQGMVGDGSQHPLELIYHPLLASYPGLPMFFDVACKKHGKAWVRG